MSTLEIRNLHATVESDGEPREILRGVLGGMRRR